MKNFLFTLTVLLTFQGISFAQQTFTINASGMNFTPSSLTITEGDTVEFAQTSSHPAREVSQATWNANGNTSNGGFDNAHSGTKIKFNTAGTYYYVCTVHFGSQMKGQIIVNPSTVNIEEEQNKVSVKAYPSPVVNNLTISIDLSKSEELTLDIYNLIGENIYSLNKAMYSSGKNTIQVDFSDFPGGAYFVKVFGKEEQYTMKIMK